MKKTSTIHLSGLLFNIEEDAYEKFSQYIQSIEKYFENHAGKKEILEDIENRMAEILSGKINDHKKVITMEDVQSLIQTMGHPDEFGESTGNTTQQGHSEGKVKKRFYRHPDDKIIGGVCGGIAAYFDIDPLWIRLAWAIAVFVFGSGLLFYILLWIIIPEAKTPSQKLEMKGESIKIENFGKTMAENLSQFAQNTSKQFSNFSGNSFLLFIQNLIQHILSFGVKLLKWSLKSFAVLVLLVFVFVMVVLLSSLFNKNFISIQTEHFDVWAYLSDFFPSSYDYVVFTLSLFLLVGVPVLAMMGALIKFLFQIKKPFRYLLLIAIVLWIIGWGLFVYSIVPVFDEYSEKGSVKLHFAQYVLPQKTIYLKMNNTDEEKDTKTFSIKILNKILYSENEKNKNIGFPSVVLKHSQDDSLRITIIQTALSKNYKEAKNLAKNIHYQFSINDSIIELAPSYEIPKEDKFHFQKVKIIIEIPQNRYIYLSKNMRYYLESAENNVDAEEYEMVGKRWLMGMEELQCVEHCEEWNNAHQSRKNNKDNYPDEEENSTE